MDKRKKGEAAAVEDQKYENKEKEEEEEEESNDFKYKSCKVLLLRSYLPYHKYSVPTSRHKVR